MTLQKRTRYTCSKNCVSISVGVVMTITKVFYMQVYIPAKPNVKVGFATASSKPHISLINIRFSTPALKSPSVLCHIPKWSHDRRLGTHIYSKSPPICMRGKKGKRSSTFWHATTESVPQRGSFPLTWWCWTLSMALGTGRTVHRYAANNSRGGVHGLCFVSCNRADCSWPTVASCNQPCRVRGRQSKTPEYYYSSSSSSHRPAAAKANCRWEGYAPLSCKFLQRDYV